MCMLLVLYIIPMLKIHVQKAIMRNIIYTMLGFRLCLDTVTLNVCVCVCVEQVNLCKVVAVR